MPSKKLYRVNCDCSSYIWLRFPPKRFARCRSCGRSLGFMSFERIDRPVKFLADVVDKGRMRG